jgi:hydroxypyruvate reductase
VTDLATLHQTAREIFIDAIKSVDAGEAVRRAVQLEGSHLKIVNTTFNLKDRPAGIYSVAIGKAAWPAASALTEILGERLTAGVITAPSTGNFKTDELAANQPTPATISFSGHWDVFAGGHPLPNRQSLGAARAAFNLLRRADDERALVIFLVSGGGSAMLEWPRDERTTLEELQQMNDALVSCGAPIEEINAVRRTTSAVKGGKLARCAPRCDQVSLIISDTGRGEEATVASGPTFDPPNDAPDAASVIARYKLEARLPESILRAIKQPAGMKEATRRRGDAETRRKHYVLLDNESALEAAAEAARVRGFAVEIARDVIEQPITEGCSRLISRLFDLRRRTVGEEGRLCLISGGEFACPVRGRGTGGRNAESALRWAIELDARGVDESSLFHTVALSAGTDGVDGNSPAAGAIADETTVERARHLHLDARGFLDESDAYSFFHALNDSIVTGPTGTNVRDLRIMLSSS